MNVYVYHIINEAFQWLYHNWDSSVTVNVYHIINETFSECICVSHHKWDFSVTVYVHHIISECISVSHHKWDSSVTVYEYHIISETFSVYEPWPQVLHATARGRSSRQSRHHSRGRTHPHLSATPLTLPVVCCMRVIGNGKRRRMRCGNLHGGDKNMV